MKEKEPVEKTEPPRNQALLIAGCESDSDIPNSIKDEDGDTKDEDDKTRQLEGTGPVKITRFQEKRVPLKQRCKSDSDIPNSKKDEDKEEKVEDDKANQLEGMKSVELAEVPRKQGNTEAEDDKARSQPSEKKEKEDSTREKLVLDANKQTDIEPFDNNRVKGNESIKKPASNVRQIGAVIMLETMRKHQIQKKKTTIQKKKFR